MILFLNENMRIIAYSKTKTAEQVKEQIDNGTAVIYDGDFSFFMGEEREDEYKEFYYDGAGGIRIEYIPIPSVTLPEPTEQDFLQAEILLNQVTILENQRAQDAVMSQILLGQLGV